MSISAKPAGPQLATSVNLDIEALIRSADAGVADGCHCRGASFGSPDEGIVLTGSRVRTRRVQSRDWIEVKNPEGPAIVRPSGPMVKPGTIVIGSPPATT
jgi:hypothetical protein